MTLWSRVSDGVYLCSFVGIATVATKLLSGTEMPILQGIGALSGIFLYVFGLIAFAVGLAIILVGLAGHLRTHPWKRKPDA
jgi:hypothetical protein